MTGIRYYPVDVDIIESDEFFELLALMEEEGDRDAAWAAFGRLNALLSMIYRTGFALRLTRGRSKRIARDLDLDMHGLEHFVGLCVRAGWFDRRLWERSRALTSKGIQARWIKTFNRRKKPELSDEDRELWLLDGDCQDCNDELPETAREVAKTSPNWQPESDPASADVAKNAGIGTGDCQSWPLDKIRREEIRRDEMREEETRERGVVSHHRSSDSVEGPAQTGPQDADGPLACMAAHPAGPQQVFCDVKGGAHRTMLDALKASYTATTGNPAKGPAWDTYARGVASTCPPACKAGPEQCRECFLICMEALEKFDPARGRNPIGLTKKILRDERGTACTR